MWPAENKDIRVSKDYSSPISGAMGVCTRSNKAEVVVKAPIVEGQAIEDEGRCHQRHI